MTDKEILTVFDLLDDENDLDRERLISILLNEVELPRLRALLQSERRRLPGELSSQLLAAVAARSARREYLRVISDESLDYFVRLNALHLLWFDRDDPEKLRARTAEFADWLRGGAAVDLNGAAQLMHAAHLAAEPDTTLHPEDYCIGNILDEERGAASILIGMAAALLPEPEYRIIRVLDDFQLADRHGNVLCATGVWRTGRLPGAAEFPVWSIGAVLRYATANLFTAAVNGDNLRYVLTTAEALTGLAGSEALRYLPYPYNPDGAAE